MPKNRLLVAGGCRMELSMTMQALPDAGSELVSDGKYGFSGGGRGLLGAICAARLGVDTLFLGRVGNDFYGGRLRQILESAGVDVRHLGVDKLLPTALKVNLRDASGTRGVLYPGASDALKTEDAESAFVTYPDAVLISSDLPFGMMKNCAHFAAEENSAVILDVPPHCERAPLHELGRLTAAVLGEREIATYVGFRPDSLSDYVKAAIRLSARIDSDYFVFRLGSRGAYVTDGKYSEMITPLPGEPVDVSAAEETFCATFCAAFINGGDPKRSAFAAHAAATLCASKPGSVTSIPDSDMLDEFLRRAQP